MKRISLQLLDGSQAALERGPGEIRIGSAADNDLVLPDSGLKPLHAVVRIDRDGATLHPGESGAEISVNRRPVQSLAFLHDGDLVALADTSLRVRWSGGDVPAVHGDDNSDVQVTRIRRVPPKYVLRGVTGSQFGKLIPVYGRLLIGRAGDCDLILDEPGLSDQHAVLEAVPGGMRLHDLASTKGCLVNGEPVVGSTVVRHGDQIELDSIRFLVQAIDQLDQPPPTITSAAKTGRPLRWLLGFLLLGAALTLALFAAMRLGG